MPKFDAFTSGTSGGGTSTTISHTTRAGGDNLAIYVVVSQWANADNDSVVTGVTYAGSALTQIADTTRSTGGDLVTVWRRLAPATGANNVIVSWSGSAANKVGQIGIITFTDVDQTTPEGTAQTTTGNGTAPSVTISAAPSDYILEGLAWDGSTGVTASFATDNNRIQMLNSVSFDEGSGMSRFLAPSASQAVAWTLSGAGDTYALAAVNIKSAMGPRFAPFLR